ncbi:hypothetical protein QN277_009121 [Acacia crassicarpa]|uniref:Retroviral polymerase SH3-like domain-containing protein n=1 Tax=Acacia crassicarpa TaxID=499986 RepID=A0AAE1IRZ2_9FABA|nr:hypothetical protein QN277_009121 [Acacia crassicarpa]
MDFRTTKCVFLGYSNSHKGYKCLSSTGKIYLSRHVQFNESDFPFATGFINKRKTIEEGIYSPDFLNVSLPEFGQQRSSKQSSHQQGNAESDPNLSASSSSGACMHPDENPTNEEDQSITHGEDSSASSTPPNATDQEENNTSNQQIIVKNVHPMTTRGKAGVSKP